MQLASGTHIPDGLLAAMTLLNEKPRHGVASKNVASNPGIGERNSTVAIGFRASLALDAVRQSERARYYASSMGRFMSPDPLGGHLEDPQTLNKYSYVANNPLSRTDPTGLDFNLQCTQTKDNASTCQGGLQGTTTTDANGKSTFTATRISSDAKGNLSDQNGNKYSGAFDGKNVSFTGADGSKSTGSWIQNSNPTSGITGSGSLSNNFNFTFYNHGANQTLNFTFTYSGSMTQAFGELRNAGFTHWNTGDDIGFSEWRTDVAGRNSSHFLVWDPNWLEQQTMSPPSTLPQGPGTKGEGHVGEYYPGVRHTVCDVLGIC